VVQTAFGLQVVEDAVMHDPYWPHMGGTIPRAFRLRYDDPAELRYPLLLVDPHGHVYGEMLLCRTKDARRPLARVRVGT